MRPSYRSRVSFPPDRALRAGTAPASRPGAAQRPGPVHELGDAHHAGRRRGIDEIRVADHVAQIFGRDVVVLCHRGKDFGRRAGAFLDEFVGLLQAPTAPPCTIPRLASRNRVVAASTAPLCGPAMSNESMTRLIAGSASSRSTYGVREKCAVISPLPAISAAAALSSGIATASAVEPVAVLDAPFLRRRHVEHDGRAGELERGHGDAVGCGPKSRIVRIAGLRVTST